jgi:hypothetical protein
MKTRRFPGLLWFAIIACVFPAAARAEDEDQRVESLIPHLDNLNDAKFIRNGNTHDSKDAAKLPREKRRSKEKEIKTAEESIEKLASEPSTTGRPCLIRFSDCHEVKCGE